MMRYAVIFTLFAALIYSILPESVVPTHWLLLILFSCLILIALIIYLLTVVVVAIILGELLYCYTGFLPNLFELLLLVVGFVFMVQFVYSLYLFVTSPAGQNFILYVALPASLVLACDWVWRSVVPWLTLANLKTVGKIINHYMQAFCQIFFDVVKLLMRIVEYPEMLPTVLESLFGDVSEEWLYIVGGLLVLQWLLAVCQLCLQLKSTWWDKRN